MDETKENQLNIHLDDEIGEGIYSNLAVITHSHSEFIIDFIRLMPNLPKAKVKSRIVMTPNHAKRLVMALMENIRKYEEANGAIPNHENPNIPPITFGVPPAQA